ncbi:MAG TPA: FliM/FliN family flagellar motor switch protein [Kofleriaceae bacterium]
MAPNFSAYPFAALRKLSRRDAQLESTLARWIAARSRGERLSRLVGAPKVEVVAPSSFDPFAAHCEVRVGGAVIDVRGSSTGVRAIAQRLLGGPNELAAPRPLGVVERSLFTLVVATALEDLGVAGEVWPRLDDLVDRPAADAAHVPRGGHAAGAERSKPRGLHVHHAMPTARPDDIVVELAITLGDVAISIQLCAPAELLLRVPPPRPLPSWFETTLLDVPIVLGRCALEARSLDRLALRSVITLERPSAGAELDVLAGRVGISAAPNAVVAKVATGYVARDMSLPDEAHVELTVALGTTQLSLRQLSELAIGQIIQLGRPLAGPFELRAAGRVVGRGELVDVDGELAVRIVSLGD